MELQKIGLKRVKEGNLVLDKKLIYYKIIGSSRTTLSLQISNDGELIIRAPKHLKEGEIQNFLIEKKSWILSHLEKAEKRKQNQIAMNWVDKKEFTIYGEEYCLVVVIDKNSKEIIQLQDNVLQVITANGSEENVKEAVAFWFKKACKGIFIKRAAYYADKMNLSYERITLKEQKTCWGSCSGNKNLNFNWKLLLMPPSILDYVVVHELAHLVHMNHSTDFWAVVGSVIPDYKERRKWLKDNGRIYS